MVEHRFVEPITVVRFHYAVPLPFRLTAGLWPLTPAIVVRIHEGQPIRRKHYEQDYWIYMFYV